MKMTVYAYATALFGRPKNKLEEKMINDGWAVMGFWARAGCHTAGSDGRAAKTTISLYSANTCSIECLPLGLAMDLPTIGVESSQATNGAI